ncbi:Uncharacterized protein APZ42_033235 [Daphnia magna]|uniref:Uncharacterized protein n=1 Tax=Daphnia magna TaxID=35525 RepID=A0A164L8P0_9CRUS|nr:Uncharacterized protein APZ42_033235 [Daphnia magna]
MNYNLLLASLAPHVRSISTIAFRFFFFQLTSSRKEEKKERKLCPSSFCTVFYWLRNFKKKGGGEGFVEFLITDGSHRVCLSSLKV